MLASKYSPLFSVAFYIIIVTTILLNLFIGLKENLLRKICFINSVLPIGIYFISICYVLTLEKKGINHIIDASLSEKFLLVFIFISLYYFIFWDLKLILKFLKLDRRK